jgi:hypothetical protein
MRIRSTPARGTTVVVRLPLVGHTVTVEKAA